MALLALPALKALVAPEAHRENRSVAAMPAWPTSAQDWRMFPRKFDAWARDNFGFRESLIELNAELRFALFRDFASPQVVRGHNGRIFLAAHAPDAVEPRAILIPCGAMPVDLGALAREIADLHRRLETAGTSPRFLFVPSAPVLYPEDLPGPLQRRCARQPPSIQSLLETGALPPNVKAAIDDPYQALLDAKPTSEVHPRTWFHWAGEGPRLVTAHAVERLWDLDPKLRSPMKTHRVTRNSDIAHLLPGLTFTSEFAALNQAASGIDACRGPACFGDLADVLAMLIEEGGIYRNPKAPHERLVLLSDSFGSGAAEWFAGYFREVFHLSTNGIERLDGQQKARLRESVLQLARGHRLLLLYHDGSVLWGTMTRAGDALLPGGLAPPVTEPLPERR